jgi:hypothetical protein
VSGRVPAHGQAAGGGVHLGRDHAGQPVERAFHRVGTGGAVHALHHQHRLGQFAALQRAGLGEFLLLDRVVEHQKVVVHREGAPVFAQPAGGSRLGRNGVARTAGPGCWTTVESDMARGYRMPGGRHLTYIKSRPRKLLGCDLQALLAECAFRHNPGEALCTNCWCCAEARHGAGRLRPAWPQANSERYCSRSSFFCTLPIALRGSSATTKQRLGIL